MKSGIVVGKGLMTGPSGAKDMLMHSITGLLQKGMPVKGKKKTRIRSAKVGLKRKTDHDGDY